MKKVLFTSILLSVLFLFNSCDKLKELNTIRIPISSMSINLDNILIDPELRSSTAELNSFSATKTISYSSIDGLSEDANKYKSHIESITAGSGSITITSTDGVGTVVKDFVLNVAGISPDFTVADYSLGTAYTQNVKEYANKLVLKVLLSNSLDVKISGKTDVPSGKNLRVKITLENVELVAKIL
jgi:hypothetical protein